MSASGGMHVPPHPHSALQTVTWLFEGEVQHHDSGGFSAVVRPGEVNLMTAGRGIAHSEVSTASTKRLHGVQLWVVLPEADRGLARRLQHHVPDAVEVAPGVTLRVFAGALGGQASPIETATPLLGAEVSLAPGTRWEAAVSSAFEHAVLLDHGDVTVDSTPLDPAALAVLDPGPSTITLETVAGARLILLGGAPYDEDVVMWWNFIGKDHDEIVELREQWEAGSERYGDVAAYDGGRPRLPAPALPGGRLRSRRRQPNPMVE